MAELTQDELPPLTDTSPASSTNVLTPGPVTEETSVGAGRGVRTPDIPETSVDGFTGNLMEKVNKLVRRIKHRNKPKPKKKPEVPLVEECPNDDGDDDLSRLLYDDSTGSESDIDIQANVAHPDSPDVLDWRSPLSLPDDSYDFNHFRRGVAVLIVNTEFCNVKDNRPRAEKDIDYLTALFEVLDFQVKVLKNKTTRDLMDSLIDIRSQLEKDSDCFACLISTHGGEFPVQGSKNLHQHVLYTFDGSIPTDDIISTFNDNGCAAMRGKPKLFFIQACRGRMDVDDAELVDPGVDVDIITYNSQPPLAGLREESRHVSQHQGQNGTHDCANTHGDGLEKEEGHHGNQLTTQEMVGQGVDLQITGKDHGVTDGDDSKTTTKADAKGRSDDNPARMYGPGYIPFIDGEEDQTYANEEEQRRNREAWCRYQEKVQKDQEQKRRERFLELQQKREMEDADFCSISCYSHCLVMFSSAPERLAWGDDHTGGWLPYCMYNVVHWFHRYDFRTDLLQVLTEVNNEMAMNMQTNIPSKPEWHQSKSAACIYHMLTKDIYFRLKWSKKAALVTAV